jgi:hypothetical protein
VVLSGLIPAQAQAGDNMAVAAAEAKGSRRTNIIVYFLQSGSARVLNALRVGDELTAVAASGQSPKFLFQTPALNRSVVFKDLIGAEKGVGHSRGVRVGTKLYVPFNRKKLHEGGQTFFYDRYEFAGIMKHFVDLDDPARKAGLEADMKVLDTLEKLPMFAPFLVRQALDQAQIEADPAYADIPEAEWKAISDFIRDRFQKILTDVTGLGASKGGALERLLDKLWGLNDMPALESLARAFGIPPEGCLDRFYGWKGTIYFSYLFERMQSDIEELTSWVSDSPKFLKLFPADRRDELRRTLQQLHDDVFFRLRAVERLLGDYELAFNDLFVNNSGPRRFINFLSDASSRFAEAGINLGMLQHAHEVWDRLTESFPKRQVNADVLEEVIHATGGVIASSLV